MLGLIKNVLYRMVYHLLRFQNYIPKNSVVKIHPDAKVYGSRLDGHISIGHGAIISRAEIYGNVEIGRFSSINGPNIDLYANNGKIIIGNFCSIARNVSFQVANHNFDKLSSYHIFKNVFNEKNLEEEISKGDIVIGNDVWIGTHVVLLPGTKINDGAIIAANSVINSEIPAYAIVAGSPGKVKKYRFEKEVVDQLLELKWWNWDMQKIQRNKDLFKISLSSTNLFSIIK